MVKRQPAGSPEGGRFAPDMSGKTPVPSGPVGASTDSEQNTPSSLPWENGIFEQQMQRVREAEQAALEKAGSVEHRETGVEKECDYCDGRGGYLLEEGQEPYRCDVCGGSGVVPVVEVVPSGSSGYAGVTSEEVRYRSWERDQAERMGLDPDVAAGPELFTNKEWEGMTGTREARIAFGYELPCGCRPGSCSSEYGGDCGNYDYETDERVGWHASIVEDPISVLYTNPQGVTWAVRELAGSVECAAVGDDRRVCSYRGELENVLVLLQDETL